MKVTNEVLKELETLKDHLLLTERGQICVLKSWIRTKKKNIWGKEKDIITQFDMHFANDLGTGWHGVYTEPNSSLYIVLFIWFKKWRQNFVRMREDLEKFGCLITKVINVKSEGC